MNELHLFAGAGGGILGGMLLRHTCVCVKALKEQVESLEKQNQAMRAACVGMVAWYNTPESDQPEKLPIRINACEQAISATAGRNYKSPQEVAAIEALDGRLGTDKDAIVQACKEYVAAEDELPDAFDTEDYCLSHAVRSLVQQVHNHKSPEEVAAIVEENQKLRECLEPGKANAINAGLFECADRLGLPHSSVKHALTLLEEEILQLRSQLTAHTQALKVAKAFIEGGCSHREHVLATINNLLK